MPKVTGLKLISRVDNLDELRLKNTILYAYIRNSDDCVMYIGLDKAGNKGKGHRHTRHLAPSAKKDQVVNTRIQSAPRDTYRYEILAIVRDEDWMADMEASMITVFKNAGMCEFNIQEELHEDLR